MTQGTDLIAKPTYRNWAVVEFRGLPAIRSECSVDGDGLAWEEHTFFVSPVCPRSVCGAVNPRYGPQAACACAGLTGSALVAFQIRCSFDGAWWSLWEDELDDAEPVESDELLALVPSEILREWHERARRSF